MVRTFIAVELTPEIRERLRSCQEILAKSKARLTMVEPGIIHITIKFLGEVPPHSVGAISLALNGVALEPFDLTLTGITANDMRRPRVVWAAVEDGGMLSRLHEGIEDVLSPLGIPNDDRQFRPHATIARVRTSDQSLIAQIRSVPAGPLGTCRVEGFVFKKSTLTPQGPVYENIMEVGWR